MTWKVKLFIIKAVNRDRSSFINNRFSNNKKPQHILNNAIRAEEVRVIDNKGAQVGIIKLKEALNLAEEKELDLLLISPDAKPPVCKLINYSQFKYEQQKKEKLARKSNKGNILKELKMSPKISDNDYNVRLKRGKEFLTKGFKLKMTIFFKGREIVHSGLGHDVINRYIEDIEEYGNADAPPVQAKRLITVVISPKPGIVKNKEGFNYETKNKKSSCKAI